MYLRLFLSLLVSFALLLPQDAMAAAKKKKTKKAATSSQTVKKSSSSSDRYRKIGEGPMGAFVAAPEQNVFLKLGVLNYVKPIIGYEHALGLDNSWTAQIGYWGQGGSGWSSSVIDLTGSFRWWLGPHAKMQGFYLGPMAGLSFFNTSWDIIGVKGSYSATAFGVGAEGGYQWILPMGLVLNAGLNSGFAFASVSGAPSGVAVGGLSTVIVGSVGYAF